MDNTNIRAELRIMGEGYDVQEITEVLGVKPSETWCKGDNIRKSAGKRTYTAWVYSTGVMETLDVNILAQVIEELFESKSKELSLLRQKHNLDISIDFVIVIENEAPPAIYFEPQFIQFAAMIGARLDIDIYVN